MALSDTKLSAFPAGINNVAPLTQPPRDQNSNITALRSAVDVDLHGTGQAHRRRGQVTRVSSASHSLFVNGEYMLAWVDGALRAYTDDGAGLTDAGALVSSLSSGFLTYASDDDDTYWSNSTTHGRIASDLSAHPFWVDTPDPVSLSVNAAGGLAAGSYEVSVTALDADGRESGASVPEQITLTAGQGIACTLPAAPDDATTWRIYRTTTDGDVAYLAAELPITTTSVVLGVTTLGKALETAWLMPLPPCTTLRCGHGRLLGFYGGSLVYSEAYRLGLMADNNYLGLGAGGTLLEPVGDGTDGAGWWIADQKRTYFFGGADPKAWTQATKYGHPAVPGTSMVVSGASFGLQDVSNVALWLAANGVWCLGLPGGVIQPIREGELALPVDAERGASGYFEFDGIRTLLTSLLGGVTGGLNAAASDSASATIRRNGITL